MARGLNRVFLIGNLTRDPELRYTPNNSAVADLGLAVNRSYRDQSGEIQEETAFVDVTAWGKQAENCSQYLSKGSPAFVEGRLTFDSWENQQGERRSKLKVTATRIDFLGSDQAGAQETPGEAPGQSDQTGSQESPEEILDDVEIDETEDDIPF